MHQRILQFHQYGYQSTEPRVVPVAGTGVDRPSDIPNEVDVLIVGCGPAGMLLAAQMAQFPSVTTRIVEGRAGRLQLGQADGLAARSIETFQAFGFAEQIIQEAHCITACNFWNPDPDDPDRIVRTARTVDDPQQFSEFPHLLCNEARVLDYFAEVAANAPTRLTPDYGYELVELDMGGDGDYPLTATLRETGGENIGADQIVAAKYVAGCDGARSTVRKAIGRELVGNQQMQAWAVMDVLATTDFPDIRTKCIIQSGHGSILHIPREGGFLFRMYVDLGHVTKEDHGRIRRTTCEDAIAKANKILHPYSLDVKDTPWYTVYEVGHRVTDKFDEVTADNPHADPHVFIAGDACHTHSAKAGQGMNVSMQDTFNLGWKLGAVLEGRSPASLLHSYSGERRQIAQDLIDFDSKWSKLMARNPEEFESAEALEDFYLQSWEFPSGFMTEYQSSSIIAEPLHQYLASGFPLGKRFKSAMVIRVCDANPVQLGHIARADGRWRLYVFADEARTDVNGWAKWLQTSNESPLLRYTPSGRDINAVFDVKVVYQQEHSEFEFPHVPAAFMPTVGPYQVHDYDNVFAAMSDNDIFTEREIDRGGCVIVVRPDQYVAHVLPLTARQELARFFAGFMLKQQ